MRRLLTILALTLSGHGSAQNVVAEDLPEMCAAAYIFQGADEKLALWKGMFSLRSDVVLEYHQLLQHYADADELPPALLQEAVEECDRVYDSVRHSQSQAPSKTTSQASVVEGGGLVVRSN